MMTAHHRHQASLERILDFSPQEVLTPEERAQAENIFSQFISHCEPRQSAHPYKKVTLVRLTYEYSEAKDKFLQQFFIYLGFQFHENESPTFASGVSRFPDFGPSSPPSKKREVEGVLGSFAEFLFGNFFLPLRAAGNKTPQPTPAALSAKFEDVVGTPARLSILRRDCLIRDHHRCVVSRVFDREEAAERVNRDRSNAQDDDGQRLVYVPGQFSYLEVAHIIPHLIMSTTRGNQPELSEAKKSALAILDMFAPGMIHLIEGSNIDRPANAITLSPDIHKLFGDFKFYFEALDPSTHPPYTYRIDSRETNMFLRPEGLPVTRTLLLSPNRTIDPPSAKLLAIHRAISIILHLSAAGVYIDKIIRDMEQLWAKSDGSSAVDHIVSLKLGGWLGGVYGHSRSTSGNPGSKSPASRSRRRESTTTTSTGQTFPSHRPTA
ncbi:hypothetical protein D8B26_002018 [Coccidioides posadasii str. Silveira]|uniref:HNH nuclease domain-containing protein n=2 Tax=Coccidioides posadasii TaxID=199306 RepID=E9CX81_COCPS|nr:conserved hypothetical protein [Coccidioides posadasii str. Silveira]QVM07317.1 hypothetical protein D8B26_002018 [Coccidioides posadasii str. Silveira]